METSENYVETSSQLFYHLKLYLKSIIIIFNIKYLDDYRQEHFLYIVKLWTIICGYMATREMEHDLVMTSLFVESTVVTLLTI
jgi:hypothetical protein